MKDYYDIMRIPRNAEPEEIKISYRNLAKRWHPDANKDEGASDKFKAMSEAYEILSNPLEKEKYDKELADYEESLISQMEQEKTYAAYDNIEPVKQATKEHINYIQFPSHLKKGINSLLNDMKDGGMKLVLAYYGKNQVVARGLFSVILILSAIVMPLVLDYYSVLETATLESLYIVSGVLLVLLLFGTWFLFSFQFFKFYFSIIWEKYGAAIFIGFILLSIYLAIK